MERYTIIEIFPESVRNHEEEVSVDESECLPALLAVGLALNFGNVQRIPKYTNGVLEAYAMLALVGNVLGFVPLEPKVGHMPTVMTFLQ